MPARVKLLSPAILGAAMLAVTASTAAPIQRSARPNAIDEAIREFHEGCAPHGRAVFSRGFQTRTDLNGDGAPDYIFEAGYVSCRWRTRSGEEEAGGLWCGSAGCVLVIVASGHRGYREVYSSNVQGWKLDRRGRFPIFKFGLHGSVCGRVGANTCYVNWGWNGKTFGELPCVSGPRQRQPFGRSRLRNPYCRPFE
jgi:hypothetical protein